MTTTRSENLKALAAMWGIVAAVVLGTFVVVGGTMALMMIWVSERTAGFIWCGLMFLGVAIFFSWLAWKP